MTHLHIPDGVLPAWLWGAGWAVAAVALVAGLRVQRRRPATRVAYEGFLGGLMLAAMALEIPLGPFEFHLTLAGPLGVLLGPAGAFQAGFIASAVLAFVGHGGFTLIGLNAVTIGAVGAIASMTWTALRGSGSAGAVMAAATAVGQLGGGLMWAALVLAGASARVRDAGLASGRLTWLGGMVLTLVLLGVVVEAMVAYGLGRFLSRVRPDLLEASVQPAPAPAGAEPLASSAKE